MRPQEDEHVAEHQRLRRLVAEIEALRQHALRVEALHAEQVEATDPSFRRSARNLLHYLALRSYDLRELQDVLGPLGLSSLGRTESHTLSSLNAVGRLLSRQLGEGTGRLRAPADPVGFHEGQRLVQEHTAALFGPGEVQPCRVMVTLPNEAADDPELLHALVGAGMDVARINCAHGDAETWRRLAAGTREAARAHGRACTVQLDLGGPKLRTGALEPGPRVVRVRPARDLRGRVTHPARVWLAPPDAPPPPEAVLSAWIPVDAGWLQEVRPGERVRLRDARGRKRRLEVVDAVGEGRWATCDRTCYLETGTELSCKHRKAAVGELPAREQALVLCVGDRFLLCADPQPGRPPGRGPKDRLLPARIPCTLPEALRHVRVGQRVRFDDGKIEGLVVGTSTRSGALEVEVEVTRARPGGSRLRADKGINLPDTALPLSGLTLKDRRDLDVVVELADVVGLSFVNTADDVRALQSELERRGAAQLGIMLKIETRRAIEELPWLLLAAMRSRAAGVMIARGDLAVECGWERLAELQEEILWFCEAAHLPVVWATQVLESLAKQGTPSRAEITDAAMSNRAECVMLNKGPHILDAIRTLKDILTRMQDHQHKKTPRLRSLGISSGAGAAEGS